MDKTNKGFRSKWYDLYKRNQKEDSMGNSISNSTISCFITYCTLGTFIITSLTPLHAIHIERSININLNDINFGIKFEKLIEKTEKYFEKKDQRKLTDVMFELKREIEAYTGQKIDLNKSLDQVEKKAKAKGRPVDKKYVNEMRRRLKKEEKRHDHKASYMAYCLKYDLPYNSEEEILMYELSINDSLMAKHSHGKDKKDGEKEIVLPLRVTIGVTMSLIGLFLYVVPLPPCKAAAPWVLDTEIAFLIDQGITEWEDQQKKDKK